MMKYAFLPLAFVLTACTLSSTQPLNVEALPSTTPLPTAANSPTTQIFPTVTFTPLSATLTPMGNGNVTPTEERNMAAYPNYGAAPELNNTVWLNSAEPLRLADLRGQVVLLEFWTFDCINCIRTIPYVQSWHETYSAQGLVVIGNHFPEFYYEEDIQNVNAALTRLGITYPVAQDNGGATWRAYNQRYWPTIYLIDKWGDIRYVHIGEGQYNATETAIQALLAENYTPPAESTTPAPRQYLTPTTELNVRSGPGVEHGRIGAITPNMVFVVLGEDNGWYMINYNGVNAYVSGEYVTIGEQ